MEKVGIGAIGTGSMGRLVLKGLLKSDERLELRGLCDPDIKSIRQGLKELNPHAKVYEDYHELVEATDIQWVIVSSWNDGLLDLSHG